MLSLPRLALACLCFPLLPGSAQAQARPTHVHYEVHGRSPADRFGASVAAIGDIDGDGSADWIAGAPHAKSGGLSCGAALVASGRGGQALFALHGEAPSSWFGHAVAGAGDVNGDGIPDFAVGAPMAGTSAAPNTGVVYVHSGGDAEVLWVWAGTQPGERFGQSVCGAGDIDGDGHSDVAVGAPYADGTAGSAQKNAGRVLVFSGRDGSQLLEASGAAWDFFGLALAAAGDVNGDGRGDLLVGAPFADALAFNGGGAYVLSGDGGALLHSFHGTGIGDQLGHWVASAGDADADGVPDLLLGAPGADSVDASGSPVIDSGAAELRSGAKGERLWLVSGGSSGEGLGTVAGVGDVDGDGCDDALIGAASAARGAGRIRIVSGADGQELMALEGSAPGDWLGASLTGLGDVDGDGNPDLAAGAPGHDDDLQKVGYVRVSSAVAPLR